MGFDKFLKNYRMTIVSLLVATIFAGITIVFSWELAVAELSVVLVLAIISLIRLRTRYSQLDKMIKAIALSLDFTQRDALNSFPLPVLAANVNGRIAWYNDIFRNFVLDNINVNSDEVSQFLSGKSLDEMIGHGKVDVEYNNKKYSVHTSKILYGKEPVYLMIFIDDTNLKTVAEEYKLSRPTVMLINIDNLEELYQKFRDSECAAILGEIEKNIENWCTKYSCLLRKIGSGKFIAIVEEKNLRRMKEDKFNILDIIRAYTYHEQPLVITLSIGVGYGTNLNDSAQTARQAIDMALGRGGDQAAIKTKDGFEFIGGISKGVEKRTTVKARIVASAISELIDGSDNILIMGHRFADLDSLGASIGLLFAAKSKNKPVHIVLSQQNNMSGSLVKRMEAEGLNNYLVEPKEANQFLTKNTLLFVVDTHRPEFVESPELLQNAKAVVVIDHHRKMVDHVNNAVIFYHEPHASSACEMVTELLQFMSSKPLIEKFGAEALMAGIMLDTRNFVLRAGVRSFQAAAYLRSLGADTVAVNRFFANSMENYRLRNAIVMNSEKYRDCVISIVEMKHDEIRIAASQAADEMLNIEGVKSSFVIFAVEDTVNISARSLGAMNVQVIMEEIGGGGHQTMAAAQMKDSTLKEAKSLLLEAIDAFYAS